METMGMLRYESEFIVFIWWHEQELIDFIMRGARVSVCSENSLQTGTASSAMPRGPDPC